jgi:uncharacterized protein (DUF1330 family)
MNYVDPDRENFDLFKSLPRDTPIQLFNMIRYRKYADYPAGHELAAKRLSGEQAFAEYVRNVVPMIERLGGGMVWDGRYECVVTGPSQPEWDRIFIMGFPNANAFFALLKDPEYKANVLVHRSAAVLDSRLVRYGV